MPDIKDSDFWDLDDLIPKERSKLPYRRKIDTDTVLISSDASELVKAQKREPVRIKAVEAEKIKSYSPANSLISRVDICTWPTKYSFYEKFRSDALQYHGLQGKKCEEVNFFSYMPQYSDLNPKQAAYYLWWRENASKGIFLNASYSYVILYVSELINLPDKTDPPKTLDILCSVWLRYRGAYPHLDRRLVEWICDFCLINALPAPLEKLSPILDEILGMAEFKEFYISAPTGKIPAQAIARLCSNYSWEKCRDVNDDNRKFFELHMVGSLEHVFGELEKKDGTLSAVTRMAKITRASYNGSICAYTVKRRIDAEYTDFIHSSDFRQLVTGVMKYTQNIIRSALGIRSRFTVKTLPDDIKALVNGYFDSKGIRRGAKGKRQDDRTNTEKTEYESLYEPTVSEFSLNYAKEVESRAWQITDVLTDSYAERESTNAPLQTHGEAVDTGTPDELIKQGIELLLACDCDGFEALAHDRNMLPDALAQIINDAAYERIGDVLTEQKDGHFALIDDYTEEAKEWISK